MVFARAAATSSDARDVFGIAVAIDFVRTETPAIRIARVSGCTGSAVVLLVVLAIAEAAVISGPRVATGAIAAFDSVPCHTHGVAIAVDGGRACLVAVGVCRVLLVPCSALATIFGTVVALIASGARVTDPRIATGAGAVRF